MPRGSGMFAPYWPHHRTQLQRPVTGSFDCGPRAVQMAVDAATRGRFVGIERLRELMGAPGAEPTNVYEWSRALTALHVRHVRHVGSDWSNVLAALRRGDGVVLALSYGVIVDLTPWAAGSLSFRGGHAVYVQAIKRGRDGRRRTRSFDALYDGRRREVPDGPRPVRVGVLQRACEAFIGRPSRWMGLVLPDRQTRALRVAGPGLDDRWELDLDAAEPDPEDEPVDGVELPREAWLEAMPGGPLPFTDDDAA